MGEKKEKKEGKEKMKFEEALAHARNGEEIFNEDWNGIKNKDKIMYLKLQKPDENSFNTEPYIIMHILDFVTSGNGKGTGGWFSKRFPWTPSALDLFSEHWELRKEIMENEK